MGPSSGPTIQGFSSDSGNSGPTSLMKIPKPIDKSRRPEDRSRSVVEGGIVGAMERGIQSKKFREDLPRVLQPVPSSISNRKTSVSRSKSRGPSTTRWMAKAIYVLKTACSGSHVQKTTREGKGGLKRSLSSSFLLYSRAWMEAGLANRSCVQPPQPREGPAPLPGDQRAIGRRPSPHSPAISGTSGADLVGLSLFSERISTEEKKKDCEETRKGKGPRPNPVNKAADQLINSSSPHSPQAPLFARSPSSTSTSPSFPSLWTSGKQTLRFQKGVSTVKNPQGSKTTGPSVGWR
ncbi:hypothetical protein GWK47_011821 [Chionoecetes opilio]|uniref:Uncharacterized protein n=1 Tax=Chionoecetes opilio TaxID=41210 RepID=A0A8J5CPP4_CHIOP|nr:hypothetical protein GWK47_011821 [Chionoecetes opilio]